jgi:hypothetical protein
MGSMVCRRLDSTRIHPPEETSGSVKEPAGGFSPRMGRRIVATGGVRPRRTEPVVIDGIVYPPRRGGGDVVLCARDLVGSCLGPSGAGISWP